MPSFVSSLQCTTLSEVARKNVLALCITLDDSKMYDGSSFAAQAHSQVDMIVFVQMRVIYVFVNNCFVLLTISN